MESCKKCNRTISQLEPAYLLNDEVFCERCHGHLPVIDTACPSCNGNGTKSLAMAHATGTSRINASYAGFYDAAAINGISQTEIAARVAPFTKQKTFDHLFFAVTLIPFIAISIFLFLGSYGCFGLDLHPDSAWMMFGWGIVLFAASWGGFVWSLFKFWKNRQYNQNDLPSLQTEWKASWICNQCGCIFKPKQEYNAVHAKENRPKNQAWAKAGHAQSGR
jgi:hypothetical protein